MAANLSESGKHPAFLLGLFLLLAYAFSWTTWQIGFSSIENLAASSEERFGIFLLIGSFGPSLAALMATFAFGGRDAVLSILRRLIKVQVAGAVYAFVFLALPAMGILLFVLAGVPAKIPFWKIALTMLPLSPLNALVGGIIFGSGPLGEEMGWRGVMQETLDKVFHPLLSALLIGLAWTLWHAPLFRFADFRAGLELPVFIPRYTLSLVLLSFILGHLWRWSGGSLFIAIFFHAIVNITAGKLTDAEWWQLDKFSNLQIYWLILATMFLTALLAEGLNRLKVFPDKATSRDQ